MNEDQAVCLAAVESAGEGYSVTTRWVAIKAFGLNWHDRSSRHSRETMTRTRKALQGLADIGILDRTGPQVTIMWRKTSGH